MTAKEDMCGWREGTENVNCNWDEMGIATILRDERLCYVTSTHFYIAPLIT